jgi:multidrug efflux pump subunit AcrA (membrane-fusion protein)|nr:MAG TPA: minor capsid protein [Caudoviricetes sp.]
MTPEEYAQNLQDDLTQIENQAAQPLIIAAHKNHQNLTTTLAAITALDTLTPRHTRRRQERTALATYAATLATIQHQTNQAAEQAAQQATATTHHHLQNYTTQTLPQPTPPPKPEKINITSLKTKITQIATAITLGINLATQQATRHTTQTLTQNIQTEGWQWVAQLDKNTCRSCIMHHGEKHMTGTLHSHPNCRCVMAPLLSQYPDITARNSGREWFDSLDFDSQVEAIAGVASSPQGMKVVRGLADGSIAWSDLSRRARWYDGSMYWTQRNLSDILARRK